VSALLEKLQRLHDLAPEEGSEVERTWSLTLRAMRADAADSTVVFGSVDLGFLRKRLERELDERLHAQTEVAPA
jgi:hypothetical protein